MMPDTPQALARLIDHAVLSPTATTADVEEACRIGLAYQVASVCVRPCDVRLAHRLIGDGPTCVSTVIGFPHGGHTPHIKAAEARQALAQGARELDLVINIGRLLSGDEAAVLDELNAISDVVHQAEGLLKVILETSYLTDPLKRRACALAVAAGADFVKTSTGFGPGGANQADVRLMRASVPPAVGVKASGGIRSLADMQQLISCGATRIGTSATQAILTAAGAVSCS